MTTRDLAASFPNARGFANEAHAARALARAVAAQFIDGRIVTAIVRRSSDGRYLPVMIVAHDCGGYIAGPAQFNVCVTNV
jgi:alpha-beta hydrolase superfamily lysophospholipase